MKAYIAGVNQIRRIGYFLMPALVCFMAGVCFMRFGLYLDNRPLKLIPTGGTRIASKLMDIKPPQITVPDSNFAFVEVIDKKAKTALDCRNPNKYGFKVAQNQARKSGLDPHIPKDLNIVVDGKVAAKIELPIPDSEAKNFSLNSVEKTKAGFVIKADWGGGVYHYEIQHNFRCRENNFYLYKVKIDSFSTRNPDSGNFLDKKETKEIKIEPNIPIEKFVMNDFLQ